MFSRSGTTRASWRFSGICAWHDACAESLLNRGIRNVSRKSSISCRFVSIALATAAGCATLSAGHAGGGHDVHASTRIDGDRARVLVSGPAWLLHIDVDGRDDLALYSVASKDGTDADCAAGAVVEKKRLRAGAPNLVNLDVAAGETICIGPVASTRIAAVMWHARRLDAGSVVGHGQALAFDGPGR